MTVARYWPFVRGIHRSPVNSPHKGQWRGDFFIFFDLRLNKRLNKPPRRRWFETPSCSFWRHCNAIFSPPSCDSSGNMPRTSQRIGVENIVNHIMCRRFMQVDCAHEAILYTRCDLPRSYWVDHELIRHLLFMISWTYDHVYKVSSKMSRPQWLWRYGRCMIPWLFP